MNRHDLSRCSLLFILFAAGCASASPDVEPPLPPPVDCPGIYQVGEEAATPPVPTYSPAARYTEQARLERVEGTVVMSAVVDCIGVVREVEVLRGLPAGLTESAVETLKRWRFEPATLEGEPVSVYLNLTVGFSRKRDRYR